MARSLLYSKKSEIITWNPYKYLLAEREKLEYIVDSTKFSMKNLVLPVAGVISGWGGIMQAAAPYLGEYGLPALVMGNLMQGTSSAALSAYQNVTGNITANADTILSNKVRNIETVCKMLDTQGDVVKKMLKESIEGDSKAIQNL